MPAIKSAKNNEPTRIGKAINLKDWLVETETIKAKDGTETINRKNLSDTVYEQIKDGTEEADKDGRVIKIASEQFTLTIEVAKRRIPATKDGKPYEMEYGNLLPNTVEAASLLVGGNLDITTKVDEKTKEVEELPSVTKYFRQGFGMLARNSASARIATDVEGPDKAMEQAVKALMKAKGWSEEKAREKAKLMMSDD